MINLFINLMEMLSQKNYIKPLCGNNNNYSPMMICKQYF